MNIETMNEFVELVRHANFSDASRRLHLSQPTLSKHIAALEKNLGCTLINRDSRNFSLTAQGQIFFDTSVQILDIYSKGKSQLKNAHKKATVTIGGIISSPPAIELLSKAKDFIGDDIQIAISPNMKYPLETALQEKVIDICISPCPSSFISRKTNLNFEPLSKEPVTVVVSSLNPLAEQKEIPFLALKDQIFIRVSDGFISEEGWASIEEICRLQGFDPRTRTYFCTTEPLSLSPNEVLLLPKSEVAATLNRYKALGFKSIPIADKFASFTTYLVSKKVDTSDATSAFLQYVKQIIGSQDFK